MASWPAPMAFESPLSAATSTLAARVIEFGRGCTARRRHRCTHGSDAPLSGVMACANGVEVAVWHGVSGTAILEADLRWIEMTGQCRLALHDLRLDGVVACACGLEIPFWQQHISHASAVRCQVPQLMQADPSSSPDCASRTLDMQLHIIGPSPTRCYPPESCTDVLHLGRPVVQPDSRSTSK